MEFHLPYSAGNIRQGAPERAIQSTAVMKRRQWDSRPTVEVGAAAEEGEDFVPLVGRMSVPSLPCRNDNTKMSTWPRNYLKIAVATAGDTTAARKPVATGPSNCWLASRNAPVSPDTWTATPKSVPPLTPRRKALPAIRGQLLRPNAPNMRLIPVGRHRPATSGTVIPLVQAQGARGIFNTRWHRIFGPAAYANTTAPANHAAPIPASCTP